MVLVSGEPALFADKGLKSWVSFLAAEDQEVLAAALRQVANWNVRRGIWVDRIDGSPARESRLAQCFLARGLARATAGWTGFAEPDRVDPIRLGSAAWRRS